MFSSMEVLGKLGNLVFKSVVLFFFQQSFFCETTLSLHKKVCLFHCVCVSNSVPRIL